MRQSQGFAAGVCLPVPSGCFAPASQCNILTVVRDVDLLAITRLFNERGRVNAGAKDRCETFGVYWRPVFTNGWRPPQQSAPSSKLPACLLAAARDRDESGDPGTFVTCSHAALCLTRPPTAHSLHTQHIPYNKPDAMFYV